MKHESDIQLLYKVKRNADYPGVLKKKRQITTFTNTKSYMLSDMTYDKTCARNNRTVTLPSYHMIYQVKAAPMYI